MKKLFENHPFAGTIFTCGMAAAGVATLKIVTDFAFDMTALLTNRGNNRKTVRDEKSDF